MDWSQGLAARYRLTSDLEDPSNVSGLIMSAQIYVPAEECSFLLSLVKVGISNRVEHYKQCRDDSEYVIYAEKLDIYSEPDDRVQMFVNLPTAPIEHLKRVFSTTLRIISDGFLMLSKEYYEEWEYVLLRMISQLEEEAKTFVKKRQRWKLRRII